MAYDNRRRARNLLVGVAAVPGAVVLVIGVLVGLVAGRALLGLGAGVVVGVATAAGAVWLAVSRADRAVLAMAGAAPADDRQQARLFNLVEGLRLAHGLPEPALYVVADPGRNALVLGRDPRHPSMVVTVGLLDALGRVELEAVLAALLARVRRNDIAATTLAVAVPATEGLRRRLLDAAVAPDTDTASDLDAVDLTRYPPGLIGAFEKMADGKAAVSTADPRIAPLWLVDPTPGPSTGGAEGTPMRLSIDLRIAALHEL